MESNCNVPIYLCLPALLLMAALAGGLLFLAFPPVDMGPIAWVALVPMFLALSQTRGWQQGALCGFVFGVVFFLCHLQYFTMWGLLPWIAACIYQALYMLLFGLAAGITMRQESPAWRVLGSAAAWAVLAYWLRANAGGVAFSGGDLAYSQYDQLPLLQMVSVVGQFGLTFFMAAVNAALSQALLGILPFALWRPATDLKSWARRAAGTAVACYVALFVAYIAGALALKTGRPDQGRGVRVAIVQGSVPLHSSVTDEDVERSKDTYLQLSKDVPRDTELTIWPESAFPAHMPSYPGSEEYARQAAQTVGGHLLLGTLETLNGKDYNAARLYDRSGNLIDRYQKMDLVVYGEYVPLRHRLSFLKNYPIRQRDLVPGPARKVFDIAGAKVAPLICFEALFSRPTREVCRLGAQIVVVLTSDAWAQNTVEVYQHSRTAALRAVEARRYLCRAATMGESAIYDPYGEKISSIPVNGRGVLTETVYPRQGLSIYHRLGDWPLVGLSLLLYIVAVVPRSRRQHAPTHRHTLQSHRG